MKTQLTAQESLDIENRLLREMAARYARLIEKEKEKPKMEAQKQPDTRKQETVRIMMTVDGIASHQRKGLVLDARPGLGQDDKPIYWIHWAGNALAVDDTQCVLLDERGAPILK